MRPIKFGSWDTHYEALTSDCADAASRPCAPVRPVAHTAAQRFMFGGLPDQTPLSEPDVRLSAHCRLKSDIALSPKTFTDSDVAD